MKLLGSILTKKLTLKESVLPIIFKYYIIEVNIIKIKYN
jgi:hypothetical protein